MGRTQNAIRSKLDVSELIKQLGNVSRDCKVLGFNRDGLYRFKNHRRPV